MLNLGLKLGENLKKSDYSVSYTGTAFADVLGVSVQAVSWENGTTYPDITLLPTIASYFEITLTSLWEWRIGGARNSKNCSDSLKRMAKGLDL